MANCRRPAAGQGARTQRCSQVALVQIQLTAQLFHHPPCHGLLPLGLGLDGLDIKTPSFTAECEVGAPPPLTAKSRFPSPPCRGRASPGPQLPPYPFYNQSVGRDSSLPGHFRRRKRPRRPEGWPPLRPHLKTVRRAGCPHPAEAYRKIPFHHRRPVGVGHPRPAASAKSLLRSIR